MNNEYESSDEYKTMDPVDLAIYAIKSYYDNDLDSCRESLIKFFDFGHPKKVLNKDFLNREQVDDCEIIMWSSMLQDTGLLYTNNNEVIDEFLSDICFRILEIAPEEIKAEAQKKIQEIYPGLTPVGYTDDGMPCYSVEDIAKASGKSEEEIFEILKTSPNPDQHLISSGKVHMIN